MPGKTRILFPAVRVAALPFAASAEPFGKSTPDMFNSVLLTIQQASDAALPAHSGHKATVLVDALCAGAICGMRHWHAVGGRVNLSFVPREMVRRLAADVQPSPESLDRN